MKHSPSFVEHKQVCFNEQRQTDTSGILLASAFQAGLMALCLCILFLCCVILSPKSAFAAEHSDCELTEEQIAEYEADGSLEDRKLYMESLNHNRFDPRLIQEALQRSNRGNVENGSTNALSSVPSLWKSGMPTVGTAYIVLVCVDFPDKQFNTTDYVQMMDKIAFGGAADVSFPLESLASYYQRSSYGKLTITSPLGSGQRVLTYTATHERSFYTGDSPALLEEVMLALENSEDFSLFDGNNDGIIDAIYLYFAGGDSGWGTTWWPQANIYRGEKTVDGMELGNFVLLDDVGSEVGEYPHSSQNAIQVMIHETGHVLGLPDYYMSQNAPPSPTKRSGILTFDMMMNNIGDHNGFSKWVLGWLDGDNPGDNKKVTRVIVNEKGITVKQGDAVVEDYPGDTAKEFTLDSFTSLVSSTESGGILVVSNDEELNLFSQYYLFQYDTYAQNQSLNLDSGAKLPSGFRMFHVNAVLNDDKTDFKHSNFSGQVYDQLIELVDPDMGVEHRTDIDVPQALNGDFHCMLFAGDTVTPATFPSSNFSELGVTGFTGLYFEITKSGGEGLPANEQGALTISYSPENPFVPDSFALTPLSGFDAANNAGNLVLGTSFSPLVSEDPQSQAYLLVDGARVQVAIRTENLGLTNSRVVVDYMLVSEIMTSDSNCELVFPAGCFILSMSEAETVLSKEMRFKVSPGNISSIEYRKDITDVTGPGAQINQFSNLVALGTEEVGFFLWREDGLYFYRINTKDGSVIPLTGTDGDGFRVDKHNEKTDGYEEHLLEAVRLSDGSLGLLRRNLNPISYTSMVYVYRVAPDGELLAKEELVNKLDTYKIAACGTDFFVSGNYSMGPTTYSAILFNTGNSTTATPASLSNPLPSAYEHLVSLGNGQIAAYVVAVGPEYHYYRVDIFDEDSVVSAANEAIKTGSYTKNFLANTAPIRSVEIPKSATLYGLTLQGDNLLALTKSFSLHSPAQVAGHFTLVSIDPSNNVTSIDLPAATRQPRELNSITNASAVGMDVPITSQTITPPGPHGAPYNAEKPANGVAPDASANLFAEDNPVATPALPESFSSSALESFRETTFRGADFSSLSSFYFAGGVGGVFNMDSYYALSSISYKEVYFWKIGGFEHSNDNVNPANPDNNEGLASTGDSLSLTAGLLIIGLVILSTAMLLLSRKTRQATQ